MDDSRALSRVLSSTTLTALLLATTSITVLVVWTVLRQILFKNPNEPPVVFHWLPVIGSTVTYGIDPYKFFFDCQAKVGVQPRPEKLWDLTNGAVWRRLHFHLTRSQGYRLPRFERQPIHTQWEAKGPERGGDIFRLDNASVWEGRRLRCSQRQVHGAEEGAFCPSTFALKTSRRLCLSR